MSFSLSQGSAENVKVITFEDANGRLEYQGIAPIGTATSVASWKIRKFTYTTAGSPKWAWANGEEAADKVLDNKGSYTYTF